MALQYETALGRVARDGAIAPRIAGRCSPRRGRAAAHHKLLLPAEGYRRRIARWHSGIVASGIGDGKCISITDRQLRDSSRSDRILPLPGRMDTAFFVQQDARTVFGLHVMATGLRNSRPDGMVLRAQGEIAAARSRLASDIHYAVFPLGNGWV